jgi:hypothetical protein
MLAKLFDLEDYAGTYRETRNAYLKAAKASLRPLARYSFISFSFT